MWEMTIHMGMRTLESLENIVCLDNFLNGL